MILDNLIQRLDHQHESLINDPVMKSMAIFRDTKSYSIVGLVKIQDSIEDLCDKFLALLCANGCNRDLLDWEFEALFQHVNLNAELISPLKCRIWKIILVYVANIFQRSTVYVH